MFCNFSFFKLVTHSYIKETRFKKNKKDKKDKKNKKRRLNKSVYFPD